MDVQFRVLPIKDIDTALRIYYAYPEIGNKEIGELFDSVSRATISKYKKATRAVQTAEGIKTMGLNTVNTEAAYKAWGIDVDDLERRRAKLKKLGFSA